MRLTTRLTKWAMGRMEQNSVNKKDVPTNPVERRDWIKTQLKLRGSSATKLADELDVARQTMSRSLITYVSRRMDVAVAEVLGLELHELYPDRYLSNGTSLHQERGTAKAA